MRVIEVDPSSDERWERYVTAHPLGSIYHRPQWLQVLATDYGDQFVNFLCEDVDGRVVGVLPLCRRRGLPLGLAGARGARRLSSLPRSPFAGPLGSTPEAATALAEAAVARVREADGVRLQLRPPRDVGDRLAGTLASVPGPTSYVLTLPDGTEDLRFGSGRNHAAIRRAVNKAAKLGVEVRTAGEEVELRAWYQLYLETMRRHVAVPLPYRFFRAMWDILRPAGMMELLLAEDRSRAPARLLAGCLFLMSGQTVVFAFNGRREQDLAARPNDALHWHAIHEARRRGFRSYDFGEVVDGNPGLAQFKLKWGAEPQRLYRYQYPSVPSTAADVIPGDGHGARVLRAAWQRLPLRATAWVGDVLHRYV